MNEMRSTLGTALQPFTAILRATIRKSCPIHFKVTELDLRDIFTIGRLEEYLFAANVASSSDLFNLAMDGRELSSLPSTNDEIIRYLAAGATLVLNGMERHWLPAAELAAVLGEQLDANVSVNAFLSIGQGQAFPLHYDSHDLCVMQIEGSKRWQVFREKQLTDKGSIALSELGKPIIDQVLLPGEVLCIPRGHYHTVRAIDRGSTHLAVGFHPLRAGDLFQRLSDSRTGFLTTNESLFDLSAKEVAEWGRRFSEELSSAADSVAVFEEIQQLVVAHLSACRPLPGNYLATLAQLDSTSERTVFKRRAGIRMRYLKRGEEVILLAPGAAIPFPSQLESAVRCIVERAWFSSADIANGMSIRAALFLLRDLAERGYLEITSLSAEGTSL